MAEESHAITIVHDPVGGTAWPQATCVCGWVGYERFVPSQAEAEGEAHLKRVNFVSLEKRMIALEERVADAENSISRVVGALGKLVETMLYLRRG